MAEAAHALMAEHAELDLPLVMRIKALPPTHQPSGMSEHRAA